MDFGQLPSSISPIRLDVVPSPGYSTGNEGRLLKMLIPNSVRNKLAMWATTMIRRA